MSRYSGNQSRVKNNSDEGEIENSAEKGKEKEEGKEKVASRGPVRVFTLQDAIDAVSICRSEYIEREFRMSITRYMVIKGIGDVFLGKVEQGTLSVNDDLCFVPTASTFSHGRVCEMERNHKLIKKARPGDYIGVSARYIQRPEMPHRGKGVLRHLPGAMRNTTPVKMIHATIILFSNATRLMNSTHVIGVVRSSYSELIIHRIQRTISLEKRHLLHIKDEWETYPYDVKGRSCSDVALRVSGGHLFYCDLFKVYYHSFTEIVRIVFLHLP